MQHDPPTGRHGPYGDRGHLRYTAAAAVTSALPWRAARVVQGGSRGCGTAIPGACVQAGKLGRQARQGAPAGAGGLLNRMQPWLRSLMITYKLPTVPEAYTHVPEAYTHVPACRRP